MEIIYFYHFNIKTQELRVSKCECKKIYENRSSYYLYTIRNNKKRRIVKYIYDLDSFDVERSGINISVCCREDNKMEEFKKECIKYVNEYKEKNEKAIKMVLSSIDECNASLEVLNK